MTTLFNKYTEMLKNDTLTENEIINIKSRISGMQCSLTDNEVQQIIEIVTDHKCSYKITNEHAEKGIEYLLRKCLKRNGQNRATKQVINMPKHFFDAIKDYDHFTFVGFNVIRHNEYTGNTFYMPVWRLHTKSGNTIDYCMDDNLNFKFISSSKIGLYLVG